MLSSCYIIISDLTIVCFIILFLTIDIGIENIIYGIINSSVVIEVVVVMTTSSNSQGSSHSGCSIATQSTSITMVNDKGVFILAVKLVFCYML